MQFDKFMKYVAENIKEYLPPEYRDAEVSVAKAVKNNDITLNSLCIVGEHKTTPSIYLEQFYGIPPGFHLMMTSYIRASHNHTA